MKKLVVFVFATLVLADVFAQNICVGTYNIRNKNRNDSIKGNIWQKRYPVICAQIDYEQPFVLGTQEVLHNQLQDMLSTLTDYDYIGVGRENGDTLGEYAAIFYNKNKVKLLNCGNFWLNETPDKPVKGWDAACVRICTWGHFEDKQSGNDFFMFNLHMDHIGVKARNESAHLVINKIKEIADGKPVILTGDFNVDQNNPIYSVFTDEGKLADCYSASERKFITNGTFNSFNPEYTTSSRIDHIFVSEHFAVKYYAVRTDCYWDKEYGDENLTGNDAPKEIKFRKSARRLPSDHYPVFAKIRIK